MKSHLSYKSYLVGKHYVKSTTDKKTNQQKYWKCALSVDFSTLKFGRLVSDWSVANIINHLTQNRSPLGICNILSYFYFLLYRQSLAERLEKSQEVTNESGSYGNKEMTFKFKKVRQLLLYLKMKMKNQNQWLSSRLAIHW